AQARGSTGARLSTKARASAEARVSAEARGPCRRRTAARRSSRAGRTGRRQAAVVREAITTARLGLALARARRLGATVDARRQLVHARRQGRHHAGVERVEARLPLVAGVASGRRETLLQRRGAGR